MADLDTANSPHKTGYLIRTPFTLNLLATQSINEGARLSDLRAPLRRCLDKRLASIGSYSARLRLRRSSRLMVELWQLIPLAIFRWLQPTLKKAEIWYRCAWVSCRYPMIPFTLVVYGVLPSCKHEIR